MTTALAALRERLAQVADLNYVMMGLEWDHQVIMPPRGARGRAEVQATLQTIAHERFVDDEVGRLIDAARAEVDGADPDSFEASLVRVAARDWDKARRVPGELKAELARAGTIGYEAWTRARAESDFASFAPHLKRMLELKARYVECFDGFACAYDVLLVEIGRAHV